MLERGDLARAGEHREVLEAFRMFAHDRGWQRRLDEALQTVDRTGEHWFTAELNRFKGRLLLRQGHSEAAEELYRKALSIAAEQEAKLWELRAAMSLARLRHDQGRRAEASDSLAPIYGWFTEGFDTLDLEGGQGAAG